jgi:hypothetical protein
LGIYSKFGLYRIMVYSEYSLDRFIQDFSLFRVWFRQVFYRILVYTGFWFRQVYAGFWFIQRSLDRFMQDSGLFRGA